MANEIELKLALGSTGPEALQHHPCVAGLAPRTTRLGNTYFDTPEGDLEAARAALRLRQSDGRLLQTLKTRGHGSGGLSNRGEWEWEVPGPGLDLTGLAALPPMADLAPGTLARLEPRFSTDFNRETWWVTGDGASIEVALDIGEIRAAGRRVDIRELELELKEGDASAVLDLAARLAERVPLRPSDTSKAARGGALLAGRWALPPGGSPGAWLHRAVVALDALVDTGDDDWRHQARQAFQRLANLGDDAVSADARRLAEALARPTWLTPAFGQCALALARRLPGEVSLG
ncbi:CYTH domain-containing protein [Halomonas nitroreducens]|uniref:CYTH domain-containing protein n=1 Tax=Halomonas nitroreducens TaxID=447425 RepID=A0A3S0JV56_9GAMM|nr:CYTH domain-containing protein [Halomonas nitroreducens]RTQ98555.1 CYTH domain-containing protein [Halomonas nitroreducens]